MYYFNHFPVYDINELIDYILSSSHEMYVSASDIEDERYVVLQNHNATVIYGLYKCENMSKRQSNMLRDALSNIIELRGQL